MSHAPIMPFYTDAYLADTHHLAAECQGAYLLLLLHTWRHNGAPPPDDDRILSRIARVPLARWRKQVRPQLESFFHLTDGHWRQKRLEKEWARACEKIELQRQKAMKSNWVQNQRKHFTSLDSASTHAPTADAPSINHKPNSISINQSDIFTVSAVATPALTALKPILGDVRYFVRGGQKISPALIPQLHAAHTEATAQLVPMGTDIAHQLITQLDQHYPKRGDAISHAARLSDYVNHFALWPADLGANIVQTLIATHPYPSLPSLATCQAHATPLLSLRQSHLDKVQKLLDKSEG